MGDDNSLKNKNVMMRRWRNFALFFLGLSRCSSDTSLSSQTSAQVQPNTPHFSKPEKSEVRFDANASNPTSEKQGVLSASSFIGEPHVFPAHCTFLETRFATKDLTTSFIDGNELLAPVNRSPFGSLPSTYEPSDLVFVETLFPVRNTKDCARAHCLRKEAAVALNELLLAMKKEQFAGWVESAYRSYDTQCATFQMWASKSASGICAAVEQSALPGHSQHQLGTTVDLFTKSWKRQGETLGKGVFRNGFACTKAAQFLADESWRFGFVLPYPMHPLDRHPKKKCLPRLEASGKYNPKTGYKEEAWHLRYVGKENAAQFYNLFQSTAGTGDELTLEQWIRSRHTSLPSGKYHDGDAELPVCDGCNCGACSTLAKKEEAICKKSAIYIDVDSTQHVTSLSDLENVPHLRDAKLAQSSSQFLLNVFLSSPSHVITQGPVETKAGLFENPQSKNFLHVALLPSISRPPKPLNRQTGPELTLSFPDLPGAIRLGIDVEPKDDERTVDYPLRYALKGTFFSYLNRANQIFPAQEGEISFTFVLPQTWQNKTIRVALLRSVKNGSLYDIHILEEKRLNLDSTH